MPLDAELQVLETPRTDVEPEPVAAEPDPVVTELVGISDGANNAATSFSGDSSS